MKHLTYEVATHNPGAGSQLHMEPSIILITSPLFPFSFMSTEKVHPLFIHEHREGTHTFPVVTENFLRHVLSLDFQCHGNLKMNASNSKEWSFKVIDTPSILI